MTAKIRRLVLSLTLACLVLAAWIPAATASAKTSALDVREGLEGLVDFPGGPPGAIATLYENGHQTTIGVGRADVRKAGAPEAADNMRIASIAKAFSGAVALHLVGEGRLSLDASLGELLPTAPADWSKVTVAELLHHTSGVPDYTTSKAFLRHAETDPRGHVAPTEIVGWVKNDKLEFAPGKRYAYSDTDNILVGLIVEALTGRAYGEKLQRIVFGPAGLTQTSFKHSAGLALFGYQTKCGTVHGHTGNFPGYGQFAAASADGSRAVTASLDIPAPTGKLLARLRSVQTTAVCALTGRH